MNKTNQKGYALLFTVVLVSIISLLVMGLSSTTLKQLVLSLGAKDSQFAFFQSDMATECALYISINSSSSPGPGEFKCGVNKDGGENLLIISPTSNENQLKSYKIEPPSNSDNSPDPCFRITVTEDESKNPIETKIEGQGYNICDRSNPRTVERTIEVNF